MIWFYDTSTIVGYLIPNPFYIFKISSQCPRTVGVDYSLHRIYDENHLNLCMAIVSSLFIRWGITKFTFRAYIIQFDGDSNSVKPS